MEIFFQVSNYLQLLGRALVGLGLNPSVLFSNRVPLGRSWSCLVSAPENWKWWFKKFPTWWLGGKNVSIHVKICNKSESQLRGWKVKGKSSTCWQHGAKSPFRTKQESASVTVHVQVNTRSAQDRMSWQPTAPRTPEPHKQRAVITTPLRGNMQRVSLDHGLKIAEHESGLSLTAALVEIIGLHVFLFA